MTALLLLLALAGLVAIGLGTGLVRSQPRPALAGDWRAQVRAWFATLAGRRLAGALVGAGGALVLLLVLVLRP